MSSTLTDNICVCTLGASAAVITALAVKYPDRALFDTEREGIPTKKGWPIIGGLPGILLNANKVHEFLALGFTTLDSLTM
jgi:fatty acid omega-hydroxylase